MEMKKKERVNWRRKAYEERVRMFKIELMDVRGVTEGHGRRKRTRKGEERVAERGERIATKQTVDEEEKEGESDIIFSLSNF